MDFRIETMSRAHLAEMLAIERASFAMPWSERSFRYELYNPASVSYVALTDSPNTSSVAGYVIARQVLDEGHILNLAVRADLRRTGIAETLVRKVIEDMRSYDCRFMYLEVRASNHAARRLYEKLGFKVAGTRKAYYDHPQEDAVMMALEL